MLHFVVLVAVDTALWEVMVKEAAVVAMVVMAVAVATKFHAKYVVRLATPRCAATRGLMPATMEKRSMPT
jgi:hypothetical protein